MDDNQIKIFIEAALLAAGRPLNIEQLHGLFDTDSAPSKAQIRQAVTALVEDYEERGITVSEVASGFRMQVKSRMAEQLHRLWEERPPRYSRALFETLALIAYRQPITRGEIEDIRGVSVSTNIVRSLLEREWVRVVGHRDVPGRPAMFGTTKLFLDYFGLKKLDDLPPLADLADWESLRVQLNLPDVEEEAGEAAPDNVTELPVLEPEDDLEETAIADAELNTDIAAVEVEDTERSADVPILSEDTMAELTRDHGFEEIVATEWPEPGAAVESDDGDDDDDSEDADASASRG
jgi:segregation and condensation protein B